jgi:hypothetical protein
MFKLFFVDELTGELIDLEYRYFVVCNNRIETGWSFQEDARDALRDKKEELEEMTIKPHVRILKRDAVSYEVIKKFAEECGYLLTIKH